MKTQKHLSIFGVGPLYAAICALITLAAYLLTRFHLLPEVYFSASSVLLKILSGIALLIAAALWITAVLVQKIDKHIVGNDLVTTGAYAWVRNPIYSAIMFLMWAVLFWIGNLYLLVLCPVYPLLMTILLKPTEEKWLQALYGNAYTAYCKRVNRCFPWFPKK